MYKNVSLMRQFDQQQLIFLFKNSAEVKKHLPTFKQMITHIESL